MQKRVIISGLLLAVVLIQAAAYATEPIFADPGFTDVNETDWFYNDVMEAYRLGLIQGIGGGKYAPNKVISYAEYITVLVRILELDITSELKGSHWASQYIYAAVKAGILTQEELIDLKFDEGIPRQDMIKYTCKALGVKPLKTTDTIFDDLKDKNEEEVGYINAAYEKYLTEGIGRTPDGLRLFGYDRTSTRAELATMALRVKKYIENPPEYTIDRAAQREKAEREWYEKYGVELEWKKVGESGGITSEEQLTPEMVEMVRKKGDYFTRKGWKILDDEEFEGYKQAILYDLKNIAKVGDVPIVISKHLFWEEPDWTKDKNFLVIVNGRQSWIVNVGKLGNEYRVYLAGVLVEDMFSR